MALLLALAALAPQSPTTELTIALAPRSPEGGISLRWSPKASSVPLTARDDALHGSFALGPAQAAKVAVRLSKVDGAAQVNQLWLDADRDGKESALELLTCTPREQRGKWWSSFEATLPIAVPAEGDAAASTRAYPLSLWFVFDPAEPNSAPALRFTRRGWHEGSVEVAGRKVFVQINDMHVDGMFDQRDAWSIADEPRALYGPDARSLERHTWLGEQAWRAVAIDPHGRSLRIAPCDPGVTRAQEQAKADVYKADREAPRAKQPLVFGNDLTAALAQAKREGKAVFVDFATTWCGPCKQMDDMVYPAQAVVEAARDVIAVKLDGDVARDAVKTHQVTAYPTMLLLEPDGKERRRAVGYRSVVQMVEFLTGK